MFGPDESDRVPSSARLACVERRADVGLPDRPGVHRAHCHHRKLAHRGRRVQQRKTAVANQHVHRVAGRVRPNGRRGRVAVQRHLGGVRGNYDYYFIIIFFRAQNNHSCKEYVYFVFGILIGISIPIGLLLV